MKLLALGLIGSVLFGLTLLMPFSQTDYSLQTAVDTVAIKASGTILNAIVIGDKGSNDTIFVWDVSASDSTSIANATQVLEIVISDGASSVVTFGPSGLYLANGLTMAIRGTAGKYTFIFE